MKPYLALLGAVAVLVAPMTAQAQQAVALRSVRIGATDVIKTATFYQAVFGLKEVQRIERPDLLEVIMNFGADAAEARASTGVKVVVINRPAGSTASAVSPLIFNTTQIEQVVGRVVANGGTIERPPTKSATSGSLIAFVVDPAGNRVEIIQPATT